MKAKFQKSNLLLLSPLEVLPYSLNLLGMLREMGMGEQRANMIDLTVFRHLYQL